jgi:dihydrofolate reductase
MKKIKLYIAASLDGYIARPDGNLDWLTKYPMPTGTEYGYKDLMDSVDTIIMGGKTYRAVLDMDFEWPYSGKTCYIVSRRDTNLTPTEDVKFITENIVETIAELKERDGKDIWLVGGGQLVTLLLNHDLVDEMQICFIPVILGDGIPLFPKQPKESNWELTGHTAYDSGILKTDYKKVNP